MASICRTTACWGNNCSLAKPPGSPMARRKLAKVETPFWKSARPIFANSPGTTEARARDTSSRAVARSRHPEAQGEARAPPRAGLQANLAVVRARNGTHDGQTEAAPLFAGFARASEKGFENARRVRLGHAGPLILHRELDRAGHSSTHAYHPAARRMLHGIVEQVENQAL